MSDNQITLTTSDGSSFQLDKSLIEMSETMLKLVADAKCNKITVKPVTAIVMQKVIDFWEQYKACGVIFDQKNPENLPNWCSHCFGGDRVNAFHLFLAAKYLCIKPLEYALNRYIPRMNDNRIILTFEDNSVAGLDRSLVKMFKNIKNRLEDPEFTVIPMEMIPRHIVEKLVDFCCRYNASGASLDLVNIDDMPDWCKTFLTNNNEALFIAIAERQLDIKPLKTVLKAYLNDLEENQLILTTDDGHAFKVDQNIIEMSDLIHNYMMDFKCTVIPTKSISGSIYEKVVFFCKTYKESNAIIDTKENKVLPEWCANSFGNNIEELLKICIAAHYFGIKPMEAAMSIHVANMTKGKTPNQIRVMFGMKPHTPEEEEQIRKDNDWLENP